MTVLLEVNKSLSLVLQLGDCTNTNTTVCQETINAGNGTITSCSTSCCDSDNCNMPPVMPSSTAVMPSSTVGPTGPGSTTPSAGDKLRPILGLLFVVLFTLVWSNSALPFSQENYRTCFEFWSFFSHFSLRIQPPQTASRRKGKSRRFAGSAANIRTSQS